ncbi:hypothetical protein BAUCODRAFT_23648 [Baudoinia panamericana UAMH 10762]|uniref:Uncharacterized protein n=1 Tax=Baudoinia panamericana (strain UAMH 10762) TaxID=717646 RepID=M2MKW4_BAUPA|nr:uncharacterized protein BAUCODRAFT_23648 [Baudoinia panamericana UAMH 10762]EMC97331.1 hypothetical protein BAUCODRAFT_23648 [Baudoinia panamericana UAMH 10762]
MGGTTDRSSAETWQRVVAAIIASGIKGSDSLQIDLKVTATYYGTTYDTLENRFRKLKKDAAELKKEVESGQRGEVAVPARTKSAPTTPRKPKTPKKDALSAVANGRIGKTTPSKKNKTLVKKENSDDGMSPMSVEPANPHMDIGHQIFDFEGVDVFDGI